MNPSGYRAWAKPEAPWFGWSIQAKKNLVAMLFLLSFIGLSASATANFQQVPAFSPDAITVNVLGLLIMVLVLLAVAVAILLVGLQVNRLIVKNQNQVP